MTKFFGEVEIRNELIQFSKQSRLQRISEVRAQEKLLASEQTKLFRKCIEERKEEKRQKKLKDKKEKLLNERFSATKRLQYSLVQTGEAHRNAQLQEKLLVERTIACEKTLQKNEEKVKQRHDHAMSVVRASRRSRQEELENLNKLKWTREQFRKEEREDARNYCEHEAIAKVRKAGDDHERSRYRRSLTPRSAEMVHERFPTEVRLAVVRHPQTNTVSNNAEKQEKVTLKKSWKTIMDELRRKKAVKEREKEAVVIHRQNKGAKFLEEELQLLSLVDKSRRRVKETAQVILEEDETAQTRDEFERIFMSTMAVKKRPSDLSRNLYSFPPPATPFFPRFSESEDSSTLDDSLSNHDSALIDLSLATPRPVAPVPPVSSPRISAAATNTAIEENVARSQVPTVPASRSRSSSSSSSASSVSVAEVRELESDRRSAHDVEDANKNQIFDRNVSEAVTINRSEDMGSFAQQVTAESSDTSFAEEYTHKKESHLQPSEFPSTSIPAFSNIATSVARNEGSTLRSATIDEPALKPASRSLTSLVPTIASEPIRPFPPVSSFSISPRTSAAATNTAIEENVARSQVPTVPASRSRSSSSSSSAASVSVAEVRELESDRRSAHDVEDANKNQVFDRNVSEVVTIDRSEDMGSFAQQVTAESSDTSFAEENTHKKESHSQSMARNEGSTLRSATIDEPTLKPASRSLTSLVPTIASEPIRPFPPIPSHSSIQARHQSWIDSLDLNSSSSSSTSISVSISTVGEVKSEEASKRPPSANLDFSREESVNDNVDEKKPPSHQTSTLRSFSERQTSIIKLANLSSSTPSRPSPSSSPASSFSAPSPPPTPTPAPPINTQASFVSQSLPSEHSSPSSLLTSTSDHILLRQPISSSSSSTSTPASRPLPLLNSPLLSSGLSSPSSHETIEEIQKEIVEMRKRLLLAVAYPLQTLPSHSSPAIAVRLPPLRESPTEDESVSVGSLGTNDLLSSSTSQDLGNGRSRVDAVQTPSDSSNTSSSPTLSQLLKSSTVAPRVALSEDDSDEDERSDRLFREQKEIFRAKVQEKRYLFLNSSVQESLETSDDTSSAASILRHHDWSGSESSKASSPSSTSRNRQLVVSDATSSSFTWRTPSLSHEQLKKEATPSFSSFMNSKVLSPSAEKSSSSSSAASPELIKLSQLDYSNISSDDSDPCV